MLSGTLLRRGCDQVRRAELSVSRRTGSSNRGIGRTFQIPRPFHRLTMFENVALAGYFGQGRHSRSKAAEAAERALTMVAWPTDRGASVEGWARPPEEARACQGAGDRAEIAAGGRKVGRARRDRDGPGGRHCCATFATSLASPSYGSSISWACCARG